jgi:hypothetical protein
VTRLAGTRAAGIRSILAVLGLGREGVGAVAGMPDLVGVLVVAAPNPKLHTPKERKKRY